MEKLFSLSISASYDRGTKTITNASTYIFYIYATCDSSEQEQPGFFLKKIHCLTISWSSFGAVLFVSWYSPLRLPQGLLQRPPQRPPQAKALRSGLAGTTWKKQTQRDCFDANVIFFKKSIVLHIFSQHFTCGNSNPGAQAEEAPQLFWSKSVKNQCDKNDRNYFLSLFFFKGSKPGVQQPPEPEHGDVLLHAEEYLLADELEVVAGELPPAVPGLDVAGAGAVQVLAVGVGGALAGSLLRGWFF